MEKLIAFDLDGTLSRSDLFLLPAYRMALTKMGRPVLSDEVLLTMIGGTTLDNAQIMVSLTIMYGKSLRRICQPMPAPILELHRA